jgi:hypothetical protein
LSRGYENRKKTLRRAKQDKQASKEKTAKKK